MSAICVAALPFWLCNQSMANSGAWGKTQARHQEPLNIKAHDNLGHTDRLTHLQMVDVKVSNIETADVDKPPLPPTGTPGPEGGQRRDLLAAVSFDKEGSYDRLKQYRAY